MSLLLSIGIATLLIVEGVLLVRIILQSHTDWLLSFSLGLPIAALLNVLLTALLTILSIALTPLSFIIGHLFLAVSFLLFSRYERRPRLRREQPFPGHRSSEAKVARVRSTIIPLVCGLLLSMNLIYSFSHAVLLPTFQYDSATNWTHRSQVSFYDQEIAFDPDESRGMAKPQYPFLFHALQITVNQGQNEWSDTVANLVHYLLSFSSFLALFLLVRRIRGSTTALVCITAIVSIPMISLHLAQGYADITLTQELLLALAALTVWLSGSSLPSARVSEPVLRTAHTAAGVRYPSAHEARLGEPVLRTEKIMESNFWLLLSGLFVASAVWTKSEGLIAGLLPWIIIVGIQIILEKDRKVFFRNIRIPLLVTLLLSFSWPLFAWLRGLSLTPHSSDTMFLFSSEGLREAFLGLFDRGSFGITWYALLVLLPSILVYAQKKHPSIDRRFLPCFLWGGIVFFEILAIYILTPNVRFLLNAESYYRQMMLPAALLILACSLILKKNDLLRVSPAAHSPAS